MTAVEAWGDSEIMNKMKKRFKHKDTRDSRFFADELGTFSKTCKKKLSGMPKCVAEDNFSISHKTNFQLMSLQYIF